MFSGRALRHGMSNFSMHREAVRPKLLYLVSAVNGSRNCQGTWAIVLHGVRYIDVLARAAFGQRSVGRPMQCKQPTVGRNARTHRAGSKNDMSHQDPGGWVRVIILSAM